MLYISEMTVGTDLLNQKFNRITKEYRFLYPLVLKKKDFKISV